ncbi:7000_t:CDS:2 [Dentiscutata heterogama]|uniref:7000_t:CDS:1 n=1 Tax=Dentiscutata heterogama TaxID=1316150 RepID=A0ACA9MD84_9GLOM|nr:7000_t:CDS:2 [Dentiscutata heterogama]
MDRKDYYKPPKQMPQSKPADLIDLNQASLVYITVFAFPADKRHEKQEIHVSAPGAGPWAVGSTQSCSWWSNNIKSDAKVIVEIKSVSSGKACWKGEAECGTGTLDFKIGSDWDTKDSYYCYVYLKEDETCYGKGGEFTLISSYGYGYGEKKDYSYSKSDDYSKKTY